METICKGGIEIRMFEVGSFGNNVYIIVDEATKESVLIDTPSDAPKILGALEGTQLKYILQTHCHGDHVGALDEVKRATGAPVGIHPLDEKHFDIRGDFQIHEGDGIQFGQSSLKAVHVPGHTPGHLAFLIGRHCFCGDVVFPGGPGKTWSPEQFETILRSITTRVYALPDETILYPGHGKGTTVGESKKEYEVFKSRKHDRPVYGDVLWAST